MFLSFLTQGHEFPRQYLEDCSLWRVARAVCQKKFGEISTSDIRHAEWLHTVDAVVDQYVLPVVGLVEKDSMRITVVPELFNREASRGFDAGFCAALVNTSIICGLQN